MTTVAFCLLTYREDHPSGIERSIAALVEGVRRLGANPIVVAAGPPAQPHPTIIRLASLSLPQPALNADVIAALEHPDHIVAEVRDVLARRKVDAVCWADTLWGLGYLSPAPEGVRTALMVHKVRPSGETRWQQALAAADVVCPASDYLAGEAVAAGIDTASWVTVPNALLVDPAPVPPEQREHLRRSGPIRIVSRVEPAKGLVEILEALPHGFDRPVELVLAEADFEFWPGMQRDVIAACRELAARRPETIRILPPLGWRAVPAFLAGAAATIISSTEPETFCHTAAEALSVGTPVIYRSFGNLPRLAGSAGSGIMPNEPAGALWLALARLLDDPADYHRASTQAPTRVAAHNPAASAAALMAALHLLDGTYAPSERQARVRNRTRQ